MPTFTVTQFIHVVFMFAVATLVTSCSSLKKDDSRSEQSDPPAAPAVSGKFHESLHENSPASEPSSSSPGQCISRLDLRIADEVELLQKSAESAGALRSGIFDVLLPGSEADLKRMNGMAIYALQVFVRNVDDGDVDLPVMAIVHSPTDKKGKVRPGSTVSQLPQIFPISRVKNVQPGGAKDIRKLLGTHTQIIYGFIPLSLLFDTGVVAVRLKGGANHLEVFHTNSKLQKARATPAWLRKIALSDRRLRYSPDKMPDAHLTLKLLADNYCVGRGR